MTQESEMDGEYESITSNPNDALGRCMTCKYWSRKTYEYDKIFYGEHAGDCNNDKFVYDEKVAVDGLRYWDYEGYSAGFVTGESFGCVHHTTMEALAAIREGRR